MRYRIVPAAVLSVGLASLALQPAAAEQRLSGNDAARAIAAIVALGIGVAIARHGQTHDLNSDWDEGTYGQPFSPSPNVVCLPTPRQCFEHSHFSRRWTHRIFGS
jgi:hypothetical protein